MTVSNVRNADGSVRARIHFAEKPDNAYLQKLIGETPSTAVTWEVRGLKPHAAFELQLWYIHFKLRLTAVNLEICVQDKAPATY
jgi:hypothetical protein